MRKQFKQLDWEDDKAYIEIGCGHPTWVSRDGYRHKSVAVYKNDEKVLSELARNIVTEVPPEKFRGERQFVAPTYKDVNFLSFKGTKGTTYLKDGTSRDCNWTIEEAIHYCGKFCDELLPSEFLVPPTQKENNMQNFYCEVPTIAVQNDLIELFKTAGYSNYGEYAHKHDFWKYFGVKDKNVSGSKNDGYYKDDVKISLEEMYKIAQTPLVEAVKVCGHVVEIKDKTVKIGCQSLSFARIVELHRRCNNPIVTNEGSQVCFNVTTKQIHLTNDVSSCMTFDQLDKIISMVNKH